MYVPLLGDNIPQFKNQFVQTISKYILKITGWHIEGTLPNLSKFILIGAPHTSNWDAFYGFAALAAIGLKIKWMAKHTLFPRPIRGLLKSLGGIPVDRRASRGVVQQMIDALQENEKAILLITPEGTRKFVEKWKTGFYHIAVESRLPIQMGFINYANKSLGFGPLIEPTGDMEADLKKIQGFYSKKQGKNPNLFNPKIF